MKRRFLLVFAVSGLLVASVGPSAQQSSVSSLPVVALAPTDHPLVPADVSQLWMMPTKAQTTRTPALNAFATAVKLEADGSSAKALPLLSKPLPRDHPLSNYAQYYKGLVELSVGRAADARRTFQALGTDAPAGFLGEATALREAESDEGLGDHAAALLIYERLSKTKTTSPDDLLMRVGRTAEAVGDNAKALRAYSQAYYEYPMSDLAPAAEVALDRLPGRPPLAEGTERFRMELRRAEQLFAGRRYTAARAGFERLRGVAQGDDRDLVSLRLAECDYYLKRSRAARDGLAPYITSTSRQGEALFFYAAALYDLRDRAEYFALVRRVADEFPDEPWAEEALNHLATHYIVDDEDAKADEIFREMFAKYPTGRYAERAAWKMGWFAYRNQRYADALRAFERGAANFPRSDYRPSWLYWSGRAYDALKQPAQANARYLLAATDYHNSYYGRLALERLDSPEGLSTAPVRKAAPAIPLPPTHQVIRALLGLGLYSQAVDELRYAQRVWGDSPAIQATLSWAYQKQGQAEKGGSPQFALYRNSINTMKRAYPQYLAVDGRDLPDDVLRIIFPLDYWDLIQKHAALHQLDPYLVAALVAQESTFVRDIRSSARAVGLMQLLPATARQVARRLKVPYSASLLTNPEANIRFGTAYFAQNLKEFGGAHFALAAYNAGERAVRRWVAERPGLPRDEFIDDIPYPETQNYVKRILGTAEDYRRLYGGEPDN